MWGLIGFAMRVASRYLLPRRWTKYALTAGVVLFGILTTLLIDARLFWTAAMTGACAIVGLIALVVQFVQGLREKAERKRLQQEHEARRAAAAAARTEKVEKVRAATVDVAKGLTNSAATLADVTKSSAVGIAGATKRGVVGVRDRLSAWRGKSDSE
jgi:uncharacterized membrane protein YcjF (UPF0283 family)